MPENDLAGERGRVLAQRNRDLAYSAGFLEALLSTLSALRNRLPLIERINRETQSLTPETRVGVYERLVVSLYSDIGHISGHLPALRSIVNTLHTGGPIQYTEGEVEQFRRALDIGILPNPTSPTTTGEDMEEIGTIHPGVHVREVNPVPLIQSLHSVPEEEEI